MKKIACVGYHATGSGVIDDLLREFDNVAVASYGAELRILHDPDCISDLEYHTVSDPHRLASGLAIRRFIEYCKRKSRMEQKILGNEWMSMVYSYTDSLVINKYKGWIDNDLQFVPAWMKTVAKIRKAFNYVLRQNPFCKIVPSKLIKPRWYNYYPNFETYYSRLDEEQFIKKTKIFIEELCNRINKNNKEYVVLDQFVCAHNPMRDLKYVDDIKVIVVDRDPRDLYVHNMIHKDHVLPKDPKQFAVQYRLMRETSRKEDSSKILRIHYEDMIFKYEEMVPKILDFLNINKNHHIAPKLHFKPGVSINGTQLWVYKTAEYSEAVKIIEEELQDMLYVYPSEDIRNTIISEVDDKTAQREYATKH